MHKDEREADLAEFRASTQEIVNAEERAILDRLGGEAESGGYILPIKRL